MLSNYSTKRDPNFFHILLKKLNQILWPTILQSKHFGVRALFTISKIALSIILYNFTIHPTSHFLFISSIH